jgi:D-alanine-D-alanine ligase
MDKFKTSEFLARQGFDVPRNMLVRKDEWNSDKTGVCDEIISQALFPCVVKPHDDGCSVMVQRVEIVEELQDAVQQFFSRGKHAVLVEEYVVGMELTGGVMGNDSPRALPPSQAVIAHSILTIEEKFLPGAGENQTPAPLPESALQFVKKTVEDVYKTVQCKGYARIDCFYQSPEISPTGKERVVILEINTLPGLTPATCLFHQAAEIGLRPMEFIDEIIRLGREEHAHVSVALVSDNKIINKITE